MHSYHIKEFPVPRIEYPLGGSSKKGSHVYFLLQVFWVILSFCQIILLFDIDVVLMSTMVTWCHNSTIWCHNCSIMATMDRKYTLLPFLLLPPSGYSIWGTENWCNDWNGVGPWALVPFKRKMAYWQTKLLY